jgi:AraC-like DNA-binding protein
MEIITIQPAAELSPYIECFYFLKSDDPEFTSVHYSFPHVLNALSIYKDAEIASQPGSARIRHQPQTGFRVVLQKKEQLPLRVSIEGPTDRITILFKLFGLNAFLGTPVGDVMGDEQKRTHVWQDLSGLHERMTGIFASSDYTVRAAELSAFLQSQLRPFDPGILGKATAMLEDFSCEHSVAEIAAQLRLPSRTFNRLFRNATGVSPVEYRRIAKFRHSLGKRLAGGEGTLSELAHASYFYDQSDFIKLYRKLTGQNPKAFFRSVDRLAENRLIVRWG